MQHYTVSVTDWTVSSHRAVAIHSDWESADSGNATNEIFH